MRSRQNKLIENEALAEVQLAAFPHVFYPTHTSDGKERRIFTIDPSTRRNIVDDPATDIPTTGGERGKTKITMGRGRGKLKTNRGGEGKRRARISHGPRNVKTSANLALVYTQRQLHSSHGLTGKASLPLFLASCLPSPCSLGPLPTKKAQVRAYYNADSISPPTFFSLLARQIRSERERERKKRVDIPSRLFAYPPFYRDSPSRSSASSFLPTRFYFYPSRPGKIARKNSIPFIYLSSVDQPRNNPVKRI